MPVIIYFVAGIKHVWAVPQGAKEMNLKSQIEKRKK
jgi:hypothetical protein